MTAMPDDIVDEALSLIEDANLPHPSGPLLSSFVTEALNSRLAADYVLKTNISFENGEAGLSSLVSDWRYLVECLLQYGSSPPEPDSATQASITKRDGARCCISGRPGSFWDPLVVAAVTPVPSGWIEDKPRIFDMLGAFFTPSYRDWWLAYARSPNDMSPYHNHWLVRKSAAQKFNQGLIKLIRLQPSMIEYEVRTVPIGLLDLPSDLEGSFPLLGDHSCSRIDKIDARFLGTHARLSSSYRWLDIAKQIASNKVIDRPTSKSPPKGSKTDLKVSRKTAFSPIGIFKRVCFSVWLMAPGSIRVATYKMLQAVGRRLYGPPNSFAQVQRLPFGMYLKYFGDPEGFRNEFNALRIVQRYTSIPVPQPLDVVSVPTQSQDPFYSHDSYLLTSRVPGLPLSSCMEMLSDKDASDFVAQMQDYVTQLRAIPKEISPGYVICNTLGGACRDPRIRDGNPVGPFVNEGAFNQVLLHSDDPSRRGHNIVFTHADLNLRNVLVEQVVKVDGTRGWSISGIVDWENSGYYPEYWDYTKALFEGFRYSERWSNLMHQIFTPFGDLSKEFEIEKRSWGEGDGVM